MDDVVRQAERLIEPYRDVITAIQAELPGKIARWQRFFETPGRGRLMFQAHLPVACDLPVTSLVGGDLVGDLPRLVAERAAVFLAKWRGRPAIDDDLLGCTYFGTGIAEEVAFWGGEVTITEQTSWAASVIDDVSDASIDAMTLDADRLWSTMPLEACRLLGKWGVLTGPRGTFGPFDLACGVRGQEIMTDLIEHPEAVHRLLDKAVEAAVWWSRRLADAAPVYDGGTIIPYFGMWLPDRVAGHVSIDFAVMISEAFAEEFMLPYEQQFANAFDGVAYHLHNVGWQLIEPTSRIKGLRIMEMTDDPTVPRTAERYGELLEACGDTPALVYPTPDEVFDNIDLLAEHNVVISMTAANLGEDQPEKVARELLKLVRDRSLLTVD